MVPMLEWYMGQCMASIIKHHIGIKHSTHGYENCKIDHILIFGGYSKAKES